MGPSGQVAQIQSRGRLINGRLWFERIIVQLKRPGHKRKVMALLDQD